MITRERILPHSFSNSSPILIYLRTPEPSGNFVDSLLFLESYCLKQPSLYFYYFSCSMKNNKKAFRIIVHNENADKNPTSALDSSRWGEASVDILRRFFVIICLVRCVAAIKGSSGDNSCVSMTNREKTNCILESQRDLRLSFSVTFAYTTIHN